MISKDATLHNRQPTALRVTTRVIVEGKLERPVTAPSSTPVTSLSAADARINHPAPLLPCAHPIPAATHAASFPSKQRAPLHSSLDRLFLPPTLPSRYYFPIVSLFHMSSVSSCKLNYAFLLYELELLVPCCEAWR